MAYQLKHRARLMNQPLARVTIPSRLYYQSHLESIEYCTSLAMV